MLLEVLIASHDLLPFTPAEKKKRTSLAGPSIEGQTHLANSGEKRAQKKEEEPSSLPSLVRQLDVPLKGYKSSVFLRNRSRLFARERVELLIELFWEV